MAELTAPREAWEPPVIEPMAARRLDALLWMSDAFLAHGGAPGASGERYQVVVHVDADTLHDAATGERCALEDGPHLAAATVRRLGCEAEVVRLLEDAAGQPLALGRKTRALSPALRRALHARDGGCRFPGCVSRHRVEGHHVRHWADGGRTELANLVQLCKFHHALVHEGGYRVEALGGGEFVFRRPDGRRIARAPALAEAAVADAQALYRVNREAGLDIDERTGDCRWTGETMDYAMAVQGLLQEDGLLECYPAA